MSLFEIASEFEGAPSASMQSMQIKEIKKGKRLYQSIEINGFNGNASQLYDGIYDPTLTDSGVPVYQKRSSSNQTSPIIILEYRVRLKQYQIKTAKYKGTDVCFAMTQVASPYTPELLLSCIWNVPMWKGVEESWQECKLQVSLVRKSYRVTGLADSYEYLNGVYSPSNLSAVHPMYQHSELPQLFLRQMKSSWEIIDADSSMQLCSRLSNRFMCCLASTASDSFLNSIVWYDVVTGVQLTNFKLSSIEFIRLRHEVSMPVPRASSSPLNMLLLHRQTSELSIREDSVRSTDSSTRTNDSKRNADERKFARRISFEPCR